MSSEDPADHAPSREEIGSRIAAILRGGFVWKIAYFQDALDDAGLSMQDVFNVLRNGHFDDPGCRLQSRS